MLERSGFAVVGSENLSALKRRQASNLEIFLKISNITFLKRIKLVHDVEWKSLNSLWNVTRTTKCHKSIVCSPTRFKILCENLRHNMLENPLSHLRYLFVNQTSLKFLSFYIKQSH
jgi:hypothetical protein